MYALGMYEWNQKNMFSVADVPLNFIQNALKKNDKAT